jgi:hypothetical protein
VNMSEITRLRTRLKNVQRNVTEYRMTVTEARNLLKEIEDLQKQEKPQQVVVEQPITVTRIMDGGSF